MSILCDTCRPFYSDNSFGLRAKEPGDDNKWVVVSKQTCPMRHILGSGLHDNPLLFNAKFPFDITRLPDCGDKLFLDTGRDYAGYLWLRVPHGMPSIFHLFCGAAHIHRTLKIHKIIHCKRSLRGELSSRICALIRCSRLSKAGFESAMHIMIAHSKAQALFPPVYSTSAQHRILVFVSLNRGA
jgi:hypothetical protein